MPDFNIRIAVDPSGAPAAIANVKQPLTELEAQGAKTGQAISQGMAGAQSSAEKLAASGKTAGDALAAGITPAAEAVSKLSEQLDRQQQMLDKIRGPAKEYQDNLTALVGLAQRGAITAQEYQAQLAKLNEEFQRGSGAKMPGEGGEAEKGVTSLGGMKIEGLGDALASQGGELGGVFKSIASGAALEGAALVGLTVEAGRLGDEYITLQNSALRLTGSFDTVDDAISQQLNMSKQLHGSLEQTMELSIAFKERTNDLGLSMSEQAQYTKEFAETVQLDGHALGDAAPAFDRLSVALQSGIDVGRAMREVLIEFPTLAEQLEEHFGVTTPAALYKLGNEGKISMQDLFAAMDEHADETEDKFGHMQETIGQSWQHFKDDLTVTVGKLVESSGAISALGSALKGLGSAIEVATAPLQKFADTMNGITGGHMSSGDLMSGGLVGFGELIDKLKGSDSSQLKTYADLLNEADKALLAIRKDNESLVEQMATQRTQIDLLNASYSSGAVSVADYTKQLGGLASTLAALTDKKATADAIADMNDKLPTALTKLDNWFGKLNATMKVTATTHESLEQAIHKDMVAYDEAAKSAKLYNDEVAHGIYTPGQFGIHGQTASLLNSAGQSDLNIMTGGKADAEQDAQEKEALALMNQYATAADKYVDAQTKINDANKAGAIDDEHATQMLKALHDQYDDMASPADKMANAIQLADEKLASGIYSAQDYARALKKIGDEYDAASAKGTNSFSQGIENAFKKLGDESKNIAKDTEQAFTKAFDSINSNIISTIMTGKANWTGMLQSIEKDVLNMALKNAEGGLVNALSGSGTGAQLVASMTTGGTVAGTEIATAMTTAGIAVGTEIASAMATSSIVAGSSGGWNIGGSIASALGGAATGGDIPIPYAANGFAGVVGGYGPPDSKLAMFHVTPGETVMIRTPEQMASGHQQAPQEVHNHYYTQGVTRADVIRHMDSPEGNALMNAWHAKNQTQIRGSITRR